MKKVYHKNTKSTPKKVANQTQPKKRETAAWILAILMIIWTVGSVLGTIGFAKSVNADTIPMEFVQEVEAVEDSTAMPVSTKRIKNYSFDSSDFSYSFRMDIINSMIWLDDSNRVMTYSDEFIFSSGSNQRFIKFGTYTVNLLTSTPNNGYEASTYELYNDDYVTDDIRIYALNSSYTNVNAEPVTYFPNSEQFYPYAYSMQYVDYGVGLGGAILQLVIQEKHFETGEIYQYYVVFDTFSIESSGIYLTAYNHSITLSNSPFYLIEGLDFSYAFSSGTSYSNGYNDGLADGLQVGRDEGYDEGYDAGHNAGYDEGRENGYNVGKQDGYVEGVASANEYSFAGFLGAIFDVPVQTFQSLFTFEILGTDISSFLLALLTVMIILAIIKLVI